MNPFEGIRPVVRFVAFACFLLRLFYPAASPLEASDIPDPATIALITWRGETNAERGFLEGINQARPGDRVFHFDAAQSRHRLHSILDDLKKRKIDLIYVFGTTATQIVLSRFKDVPVVFNVVSQPVAAGIVADWRRSENNATGVSNRVPLEHQLKALKKVVDFKVLAVIYNPDEQNSLIQIQMARELEERMGFKAKEYRIRARSDIAAVLADLDGKADAVYLPADSLIKTLGGEIMAAVNSRRLPSLASVESMVPENGVLLGLVPSYYQLGRMAAEKAVLILSGVSPRDIPSSCLDYFQMWVNMHTAKRIDVQIPMSILMMADKIVR